MKTHKRRLGTKKVKPHMVWVTSVLIENKGPVSLGPLIRQTGGVNSVHPKEKGLLTGRRLCNPLLIQLIRIICLEMDNSAPNYVRPSSQ